MTPAGFPHSDTHGSSLASSSPWLFAGSRVLHRLLAPRHPPCALCSLTLTTAWLLPGDRLVPLSQFFGWVVEPEVSFVTSELAAFCALCSRSCPSRPDGRSEAASRPQIWFRFLLVYSFVRKRLRASRPRGPGLRAKFLSMEDTGLEPVTSGLQSRRSPS